MKVLGGAGGGALGDNDCGACKDALGESSAGGGCGGVEVSSYKGGLKSYTMFGNFCDRNCWRPLLDS